MRGNPSWNPLPSQRAGGRRGDPDVALAIDPVSCRPYAEIIEESRAALRITQNQCNEQKARANELFAEKAELRRMIACEIILRTGTGSTQINEHGKTLFEYLRLRFVPMAVVGVVLAALGHFHRDKEIEVDIYKEASKAPFVRNMLKKHKEEVIEERDKQIYDHLTNNVFNEVNRKEDGTKERNRLAPDSKQWAPEPINMRNILAAEAESVARVNPSDIADSRRTRNAKRLRVL